MEASMRGSWEGWPMSPRDQSNELNHISNDHGMSPTAKNVNLGKPEGRGQYELMRIWDQLRDLRAQPQDWKEDKEKDELLSENINPLWARLQGL